MALSVRSALLKSAGLESINSSYHGELGQFSKNGDTGNLFSANGHFKSLTSSPDFSVFLGCMPSPMNTQNRARPPSNEAKLDGLQDLIMVMYGTNGRPSLAKGLLSSLPAWPACHP